MTATAFDRRAGDPAHAAACEGLALRLEAEGIELVRIGWCDLHGVLRGKTLVAGAVTSALQSGVGMVSTILLKDTSDRTAYPVFEPGEGEPMPGFRFANNVLLWAEPTSFRALPWASATGWLRAEASFDDGAPVPIDTRFILRRALDRLRDAGFGLTCGLEVEFHVYRLSRPDDDPSLDPERADWPGEPPAVRMIHPGYNLLAEGWSDMAGDALAVVKRTCDGLDLPLRSLEVELGPSQVEAVFDPTDALTAADQMVLFRNGVRQALRRKGFHASFVCRPPFANVMASGWHLHQSLVDLGAGENAFVRTSPAPGSRDSDALHILSEVGAHWLAGLVAHARGMTVFCAPTINAYGRFKPNAMAPQSVVWGRDNRGASFRVLGRAGDPATRIENRIGEPCANPYLYMAAQIHAGLDGIERRLAAPPAVSAPYPAATASRGAASTAEGAAALRVAQGADDGAVHRAAESSLLPTSLGVALDALAADTELVRAFTPAVVDWLVRVKRSELARHDAADDKAAWQAREYFSRF